MLLFHHSKALVSLSEAYMYCSSWLATSSAAPFYNYKYIAINNIYFSYSLICSLQNATITNVSVTNTHKK